MNDTIGRYVASLSDLLGWIIVGAVIYRTDQPAAFSLFILLFATVQLIAFIAPALGSATLLLILRQPDADVATAAQPPPTPPPPESKVLNYASAGLKLSNRRGALAEPLTPQLIYNTACNIGVMLAIIASAAALTYAWFFSPLHGVSATYYYQAGPCVVWLTLGVAARIISAPAGIVLRSRFGIDARSQVLANVIWVLLFSCFKSSNSASLQAAAVSYVAAGAFLLSDRMLRAANVLEPPVLGSFDTRISPRLLASTAGAIAGPVSDYVYAPVVFILVNGLFYDTDVGRIAPLVQIDLVLLLLTSAAAEWWLHRCQHQGQDLHHTLRRGAIMLAIALLAVCAVGWLTAPWLLRIVYGEAPPAALSLLPLMLVHTVIAGSSILGRQMFVERRKLGSVFFSAAVIDITALLLIALLTKLFGQGIRGVFIAIIAATTARCAINAFSIMTPVRSDEPRSFAAAE